MHRQSVDVINSFAFRIINDSIALEEKTTTEASTGAQPPKELISLFLSSNARQDEGEDLSVDANLIQDMVVNFIVAGKDTTSHSPTWFIVMMDSPPVPWVSRQANAATVLSDGTPIANGMRIGMLVYGTGRSKAVWGEDALEFKPERWLDAGNNIVSVSPFKFAPFIGGPRQCLGIKFAILEMKCALTVLLSKF